MKKKIMIICLLFALLLPGLWAQAWYTGDGGKGIRLTVGLPAGKNLAKADAWLTEFVQGSLIGDFQKYSAMTITGRQELDKIIGEQKLSETGFYEEKNFALVGQLTGAQYILSGSITKQPKGDFSLQLGIAEVEKGVRRASFNKICTEEALNNATALKEAALELLSQMGVSLTEEGKKALAGGLAPAALRAETALSKALSAQKNGAVVEALSCFYQAVSCDPSQAEAASRLNVLSANISSGNMGDDARNDIQWRKNWIARLEECERYFADYMKAPQPYILVYRADLQQSAVDSGKETLEISGVTLWLLLDDSWLETPQNVVNKVREGLMATGRTEDWGLDWPEKSVAPTSPFTGKKDRLAVEVQLLNDKGKLIGRRNLTLSCGWETGAGSRGLALRPAYDWKEIKLSGVRAADITDKLNITVAGINRKKVRATLKNKRISIIPYDEYVKKGGYMPGCPGPAGGVIAGRIGGRWLEAAPADLCDAGWEEAKRLCDGYELNGYTDWRLPDRDELDVLYRNLNAKGLGNFKDYYYYWSSSETDEDGAWGQGFGDGSRYGGYRGNRNCVRAVRAF